MSSPCVDVLFIQGAGRGAHAADRAVSDALGRALGDGYRVHFPHMPAEDAPDNDVWKRAISTALRRTRSTFLVAHSAGAAIAADMLASRELRAEPDGLRAVVLLAPPFVGEGGWPLEDFHLDAPVDAAALGGLGLELYFGSADQTVPPSHADRYATLFPDATTHRLPGCDHQFGGFMARIASDLRARPRA